MLILLATASNPSAPFHISTNWKTQMVKVLKGGNSQQKIVNTLMQLMQSEEEAMINRHFRNTKARRQHYFDYNATFPLNLFDKRGSKLQHSYDL